MESISDLLDSGRQNFFVFHFIRLFLIFRDGEGREREKGKHRCGGQTSISCLLVWVPTGVCAAAGDQSHNLGLCPNRELNLQLFILRGVAPTNDPTQARAIKTFRPT